jgi:ketosteroid isomerase-like protein
MDRSRFESWVQDYLAAWASDDREEVEGLFAADAVYRPSGMREAWVGRDEILRRWLATNDRLREKGYEVLAVDGNVGVARIRAVTRLPGDRVDVEHDGVLVITFDDDGRCLVHREWYERRELD